MSRRDDMPDDPRLDELLAAAAAPGRPHELDGAADALAALRRAQQPTTPVTRRRRVLARLAAATLTTKIALATLIAGAVAGTVVAGATGHLPGQNRRPDPVPTTTPGPSGTDASRSTAPPSSGASAPTSPGSSGSSTPSSTSSGASTSAGRSPSPSTTRTSGSTSVSVPPSGGPVKSTAGGPSSP